VSDDIDHDYTNEVVCPWCGHEHECSYEFFERNRESTESNCGECGKPFAASRYFDVSYSTKKIERNDPPAPPAVSAAVGG
jgi:transcription elongation factor Elf1